MAQSATFSLKLFYNNCYYCFNIILIVAFGSSYQSHTTEIAMQHSIEPD